MNIDKNDTSNTPAVETTKDVDINENKVIYSVVYLNLFLLPLQCWYHQKWHMISLCLLLILI